MKIFLCFSRGRKLVYVGEPGLVSDGFVHLADRFEMDKKGRRLKTLNFLTKSSKLVWLNGTA